MPFGAPKCPKCGKAVYFAERQNVLGKDWHKVCVKCDECGKKLEPGNLSDNNGKIYCKTCHGKVTGMKGYGYGGAGGSLASYESYGKGESELIGGDGQKMEPSGRSGDFAQSSQAAKPAGGTYFCTECGFKLSAGSKFCSQCGTAQ
mmetsp:Transcript_25253/g.39411  ORF Transcript_25253/g.39411 Transcript_25253/m.39411 type:complete len:146 (-) Transcript_25253:186-623(-)|eukprot:CAMPEP_0201520088 /NCGR_PEP_ID=MMETSP0161_2-20130828/10483_1 /ASSEMBLY_ACC=CAM_ASM_000251 /TAXON_ID=180227 /ORGANISM="Neoparamoeba aestuarina, Strain SoJaBio B1-5/56/2" /LENGTH=145 /DNA_ID=CAMNT_0047918347 /DNA_START=64 /DNA_END=501 /DNA_ORIENTATION=+